MVWSPPELNRVGILQGGETFLNLFISSYFINYLLFFALRGTGFEDLPGLFLICC
jgi:hypothetical protein